MTFPEASQAHDGASCNSASCQLPRELIDNSLERVLRSRTFSASRSLRRLLRFLVEKALDNPSAQFKEYVIAVEVFSRPDSFDPRIDPIVRVEAGRLRTKLHLYYSDEGTEDPLLIDIPKGSYSPHFRAQVRTASESGCQSRQPSGKQVSIALLPFTPHSEDVDTDSALITEVLVSALSSAGEFRVAPITSTSRCHLLETDMRSLGSRLNVDFIIEGSVFYFGSSYLISAHLIDVASGYISATSFHRMPSCENAYNLSDLSRWLVRFVISSFDCRDLKQTEGPDAPLEPRAEKPIATHLGLQELHTNASLQEGLRP